MSIKLSNKIQNFLILLPFVLIYLGAIFLKVHHFTGSMLKMAAFFYMILYVLIYQKTPLNLLLTTSLFLLFLVYAVWHSFNFTAGYQAAIRYMFPVVTIFYGYSIRKHFPLILKFIIVFILINFLAQFSNYYHWYHHELQWFYHFTKSGHAYFNTAMGIMRASGIVVYFAFFAFMNMIAFFLIKTYYQGKYKKTLMAIALLMMFASLSFKTIGSFIIVLMFYYHEKILNLITLGFLGILAFFIAFPMKSKEFLDNMIYRLNAYILMKKPTVRGETYHLMVQEFGKLNLFGRGAGAFGGPASLQFHSPYYKEVNFTWPDTFWMNLTTVDTFPPHVFIELGIVGGLLFFIVLTTPLFRRKVSTIVLIIYFTLFFDMLFTFSLASLEYMMFSLVLIYPILYYEKQLKEN